jgi:hypothetical protein
MLYNKVFLIGNTKLVFIHTIKIGNNVNLTDFYINNPTTDIVLNNITDMAGNAPVFGATTIELANLLKFLKQTEEVAPYQTLG